MGRKPSASKNNDTLLSPENAHPSQERVEQQSSSGNGNIKSTRVLGSQLENPQPTCSPLKRLNFPVDGVGTSFQRNTPQEKMNQEFKHKKKYATFSRKKSKYGSASVRRSERIKSGVVHPPNSNQGIEYMEDITGSESEKDEPATQILQVLHEPEMDTNLISLFKPENAYPSQERVEQQASSGNIKLERALDSQLENPQPRCSPLKHLNLSVDGVGTSLVRNTPQEQMNQEIKHKKKYATFIGIKSKNRSASVRRSERIKSGVVRPPNSNCGIEYIEDTTSGSEKDEPDTRIEQVLQEPELEPQLELEPVPEPEPEPAENLSGKSLGEKVDYALQKIEALDKITEFLTSKADGNVGFCEAPSMASISYRSMYIDSQKKLEALTNENRQLAGKLENALGKIEMYEEWNRVLSEQLDANAAVFLNLAKTAEAAGNVSTRAIHNTCSASASKRKRNES